MSYRRTMLEEQVKILKEASKVVTEELDNAKDVKMEVENAFDRIKKWYGSVYNNVKQQKLNEKCFQWLGNINKVIGDMNAAYNSKKSALDAVIDSEEDGNK